MKKIMIVLVLMLLVTGTAFAASITAGSTLRVDSGATDGPNTQISAMSANVLGTIVSGSTNFAAVLKHLNGNREFATSSADTKIYWNSVTDANKGTANMGLSLTSSTSSQFNSWSKL